MIDVEMSFGKAEMETKRLVLPVAKYSFMVDDIKPGNTQAGRPTWSWKLRVTSCDAHPELVGRNTFINTVLPWLDPATGKIDTSGMFVLVGLLGGLCMGWKGTQFDDTPALYMGGTATADVSVKVRTVKDQATGNEEQIEDNTYKWIKK
jgi:hypothetical protein